MPLELGGWQLVTLDSGASHSIASSGYNERRDECRRACEALGIESLRDADPAALDGLPEPLGRRARHMVEENGQVDAAVEALRSGDIEGLARLIDASHASLRDLYEVPVPAVERTVEVLKAAAPPAPASWAAASAANAGACAAGRDPRGAVAVAPGDAARIL